MFQITFRILFLLLSVVYLIFYYNISKASRIALFDTVPSQEQIHELQYCIDDSDCVLVDWVDCNDCNYSRALNKKYANYFYDNADYYNYPIGFNKAYCTALSQTVGDVPQSNFRVECHGDIKLERAVSAKCDTLLKQCYGICTKPLGKEGKCSPDKYINKFFDIFLAPLVYNDEK